MTTNDGLRIEGSVAPGFEAVKALYEHNMQTLAERNTQLCVYHRGEKVVDLWGSATDDADFSADSLVNVFSSGKSLETIAIASLVGKGLLDYNAKVTDYWPEFGANGKGETTVADLLRHEGGMAALETSLEPDQLLAQNIKQNAVGKVIEEHDQKFRAPDQRREYHALTRGWLINEVFRRVDPEGRTIGEFLREEISGPLDADVIIGVKEDELHRRSPVAPLGAGFVLAEGLKPRFLNRKMERNVFQLAGLMIRLLPGMRGASRSGAPDPFEGMTGISLFNQPEIAMGETPSANAHCSARGLAKVAAMMSLGGKWGNEAFITDDAWQALHGDPVESDMGIGTTNFSQGGLALFRDVPEDGSPLERGLNVGREGFYGWMGLGGSIFQWHPDHQIGFAYVPTSLNVLDFVNERGKAYQAAVVRCVETIAT
jgi:CubicO group peptidase (beta-lactamase class C family)